MLQLDYNKYGNAGSFRVGHKDVSVIGGILDVAASLGGSVIWDTKQRRLTVWMHIVIFLAVLSGSTCMLFFFS